MGLYVSTGDDCNSAFKGKGEVAPLKKLQQYPRFHKVFQDLGSAWDVQEELYSTLEEFTCVMYGNRHIKYSPSTSSGFSCWGRWWGKRISCLQSPKWIFPAFRHARIHCLPILSQLQAVSFQEITCSTVWLHTSTWWPWLDQGQWLSRAPVVTWPHTFSVHSRHPWEIRCWWGDWGAGGWARWLRWTDGFPRWG